MADRPLRHEFFLLVFEKILLGAIIGVAFVVYDQIRTQDQRRFEETHKRAEYVKTLLPLVVDKKNSLSVRISSLGVLHETGSITHASTVTFALKFLEDCQAADDPLALPDLIPILARSASETLSLYIERHQGTRNLREIYAVCKPHQGDRLVEFKLQLFQALIRELRAGSKNALDDEAYVSRHWQTLIAFVPQIHDYSTVWFSHELLALKVMAAIHLSGTRESELQKAAAGFLVDFIRNTSNSARAGLVAQIMWKLKQDAVVSLPLAEASFGILSDPRNLRIVNQSRPGSRVSHAQVQAWYDAGYYFVWVSGFPATKATTEKLAIRIVEDASKRLEAMTGDEQWPSGDRGLVHFSVCALVQSGKADNSKRGGDAERALRRIFAIDRVIKSRNLSVLWVAGIERLKDVYEEKSEKNPCEYSSTW